MRAISLWQPYASAIALGLKTIETRHWSTKCRGPLVIHASKRWGPVQREFAAVERALGRLPARLPLGALVAVVDLVDCIPIEEAIPGPIEKLYGNFGPGRFAWILRDVRALAEPVLNRGAQGFFNVPDDLVRP